MHFLSTPLLKDLKNLTSEGHTGTEVTPRLFYRALRVSLCYCARSLRTPKTHVRYQVFKNHKLKGHQCQPVQEE